MSQIQSVPLVTIKSKKLKKLTADTFLVSMVYKNSGFLPTNGSDQAVKSGVIKKPKIKLNLGKKQQLAQGESQIEVDHLTGRVRYLPWHTPLGFLSRPNTNECLVEWVVKGKGAISVSADFQRGGIVTTELNLK